MNWLDGCVCGPWLRDRCHSCCAQNMVEIDSNHGRDGTSRIWFGKWRMTWSEQVSMHDRDVANRTVPGFLQAWPLTVLAASPQPILQPGKEAVLLLPWVHFLLLLIFYSSETPIRPCETRGRRAKTEGFFRERKLGASVTWSFAPLQG